MARALRPRLSPSSIASRKGSQALASVMGLGFFDPEPLNSTPNPVITPLAGFAGSESVAPSLAGFILPESVITSLAGFAGGRRPHAPGGRTAMPAVFR